MSPRSRRRQRHVINRRWSIGLVVSVAAVAVGILGMVLVQLDVLPDPWIYAALALGVLGAVSAMLQTIVRSKAGDEIDEAKL